MKGKFTHGLSGYCNYKCRCDICTLAQKERSKIYYESHKEEFAARRRAHYAKNRNRELAVNQEYRKKNPEKIKALKKKDYLKDIERSKRVRMEYYKSPFGQMVFRTARAKRRALARNAKGSASSIQIQARWQYYGNRCWMCGDKATCTDHVIPLALGGSNFPSNLRPACAQCNAEKSDKHPSEYITAMKKPIKGIGYEIFPMKKVRVTTKKFTGSKKDWKLISNTK